MSQAAKRTLTVAMIVSVFVCVFGFTAYTSNRSKETQVSSQAITKTTKLLGENKTESGYSIVLQNKSVATSSDGKRNVDILVTVENRSSAVLQLSPLLNFSLVDTLNKVYEVLPSAKDLLEGGPIEPNQKVTGIVHYELPANSKESYLRFKSPENEVIDLQL